MSDIGGDSSRGISWWIPRILIAIIALTTIALGPSAWRQMTKKQVWTRLPQSDGGEAIGVQVVRSDGWPLKGTIYEGWYVSTGKRAFVMEDILTIDYTSFTYWDLAGDIRTQARLIDRNREVNEGPPWWNQRGPASSPTAPWIERGITADEFWEEVRPRE